MKQGGDSGLAARAPVAADATSRQERHLGEKYREERRKEVARVHLAGGGLQRLGSVSGT